MSTMDRKAADDLVREVLEKVKSGRISKEEGEREIRATLRRFKYSSDIIDYALNEYRIYC